MGVAFISLGLVLASPGKATEATVGFGLVVIILGGLLGALFAPGAIRPGLRSAIASSAGVTLVAVPLGALGVAAWMVAGRADGLPLDQGIAGTAGIALIGLLI